MKRTYHRTALRAYVALALAIDVVTRVLRAARRYAVIRAAMHSARYWRLT